MKTVQKQKALKGKYLSSYEYSQVKTLKNFDVRDWKWDPNSDLYERQPKQSLNKKEEK